MLALGKLWSGGGSGLSPSILVTTDDNMIPPPAQRQMAKRAGATVAEAKASLHVATAYGATFGAGGSKQIPAQKMKLAMRIGRHYRLREIQPRHFVELAKSCRYSPDTLLATLGNLAAQVPDEASAIIAELRHAEIADEMLERLLDGLASHCKYVADRLKGSAQNVGL
jgi:hypothetical protein